MAQVGSLSVHWMTPEELLEVGFDRSRVVMVNEAHNYLLRCVRTREVGRRLLPVAQQLGVRHLAMEALGPPGFEGSSGDGGYLGQPEMRALLGTARDLGIELHGYEADHGRAPGNLAPDTMSPAYTNWREEEQARNLAKLVKDVGAHAKLLVWCGNSHLTRQDRSGWSLRRRWIPMGWHFRRMAGFTQFAIDQTVTVTFRPGDQRRERLVEWARPELEKRAGTAGYLQAAWMTWRTGVDGVLLSLENSFE